jgi:hypothetical protein
MCSPTIIRKNKKVQGLCVIMKRVVMLSFYNIMYQFSSNFCDPIVKHNRHIVITHTIPDFQNQYLPKAAESVLIILIINSKW